MSWLLGLLRIAISLAVLWSLSYWWGEFDVFLAADGALPLSAALSEAPGGKSAWSLYFGSSYRAYPYLLFGLTVLANLALLLGWRTRTAGACLWLFLLSLQNRAALTLSSSDAALLVGLAVGLTLPWEQRLAVAPGPPVEPRRRLLWLLAVTVWGTLLLLDPSSRAFWALGPRAPEPKEAPTVSVVRIDSDGRHQELLASHPEATITNGRLGDSRRRRYLAALGEQPHGRLATRLAFWHYRRAQRAGEASLRRVEVRLARSGPTGTSESLLGCWPPLSGR